MDLVAWATEVAGGKLADALPRRWAHVQGVRERAREAAPVFGSDGELLVAVGVLHDVGYAPDLVDTGFHPIDGARYLRSVGASERLVHLVAHHSCAAAEAELRGLSAGNWSGLWRRVVLMLFAGCGSWCGVR
ncbi:MAG TPA: HD domain-containing protein [Amycolatopsis sp.]|uniref:HD domain-containing protein n=1 Tax=Amycolatopsis sp. TaxID=37632 RepID=UPI002B471F22|nr:HD domain-containing protein [Amycolatopsis sp.]HKS48009.1 HD domain-containing protein [Amycolatopsis sp.]